MKIEINADDIEKLVREELVKAGLGKVIAEGVQKALSGYDSPVEKALKDALKADKARTTVGRISPNGLLEINRQRIQQALQVRTHRTCPTCNGSGRLASEEMVSVSLLRRIEARAASGAIQGVRVGLHPELADAFQNGRRKELSDLEQEFDLKIEIIAAPGLHRPDEQIEWVKRERPLPAPKPKPAAVTLQPWDLALPDADEEEDEEEAPVAAPAQKVARERGRGRDRDRGKDRRERAEPPKPAQPTETAEPAERAAAEETGPEAEARRRKRRRGGRKRKKVNGNGLTAGAPPAEAAFQVHSEPEGAEDHEPHWEDDGGEIGEGGEPDHAAEGEGGALGKRDRSRRRRRRRGGARSREDKGGGEATASVPAQEEAPPPPPPSWDNPES